EVDVGEVLADEPAAPVALQHVLEPAEITRHALLHEDARAALRFLLLVLVVEAAGDGVVSVVDLTDEVGDGELDLARLGAEPFGAGDEPEARGQKGEDAG